MKFKDRVLSYLIENKEPLVRSTYRKVEDILFDNEYDIFGKMMTHDSGTGFSLYVRAKRKYPKQEDAILVRTSDHPAVKKTGRDNPDYSIIVSNPRAVQDFEQSLKMRIELGKEGKLHEELQVFLNLDKKKEGKGGRFADKNVKDKGKTGDYRPRRSKKTTYQDYNDVSLSVEDPEPTHYGY